jgi:hypothetical protein
MTWYTKADEEVNATVEKVMKKYHPDLHAEGVSITVLIARSEEGPPLKSRGNEILGSIRVTKLTERALGLGDALMMLNGEAMPAWNSGRLQAVIDHELTHLVVKTSKKTGAVERDDLDRPKLKMREHDYEFGWFAETAHRFGEDSFEFSQARELLASASWMQPLLPGIEDALSFEIEPQAVPAAAKPKRSRKKDMAVA